MFDLLTMVNVESFDMLKMHINIITCIMSVIAIWKLFTKAGEAGWKSLIPFYGEYIMYKLCWKIKFFWISFALSMVRMAGLYLLEKSLVTETLYDVISLIGFVLMFVLLMFQFLFCRRLASAFGKGAGFGTLMFLFAPVFMLILAFGKAEYKENVYNTKK